MPRYRQQSWLTESNTSEPFPLLPSSSSFHNFNRWPAHQNDNDNFAVYKRSFTGIRNTATTQNKHTRMNRSWYLTLYLHCDHSADIYPSYGYPRHIQQHNATKHWNRRICKLSNKQLSPKNFSKQFPDIYGQVSDIYLMAVKFPRDFWGFFPGFTDKWLSSTNLCCNLCFIVLLTNLSHSISCICCLLYSVHCINPALCCYTKWTMIIFLPSVSISKSEGFTKKLSY